MDYGPVVQAILFALFAALTAAVSAVIAPTYDGLLVPQLSPGSAYASWTGSSVFATASSFSNTLLVEVVDPAAVLVIAAVGFLYLLRAALPSPRLTNLGPRLVIGLLVANFVLPLTSMIFQLAAAVYPDFYGLGGGAWQDYGNLVGAGGISFSWDNGVLAFVVSMMLLSLVLLLACLVAFRSALLAVLLVLLPPLTLLWSLPVAAPLARRAWSLFVEMTFLPGLLIIPLALAVGSTNILLTLGLFAVALAMPQLISLAGHSTSSLGFPHVGGIVSSGVPQGTQGAQQTGISLLRGGASSFSSGYRSGAIAGSRGGPGRPPSATPGGSSAAGGTSTTRSPGGPSTPLLAGGGPAGVAAWGVQQSIGSLAKRLGSSLGQTVLQAKQGRAPSSPRSGGLGPTERASPPERATSGHRVAGLTPTFSPRRSRGSSLPHPRPVD